MADNSSPPVFPVDHRFNPDGLITFFDQEGNEIPPRPPTYGDTRTEHLLLSPGCDGCVNPRDTLLDPSVLDGDDGTRDKPPSPISLLESTPSSDEDEDDTESQEPPVWVSASAMPETTHNIADNIQAIDGQAYGAQDCQHISGLARYSRTCECGTNLSSKTLSDFKKSLKRHHNTQVHRNFAGPTPMAPAEAFHCPISSCDYAKLKSFTREDNVKRHMRDVHHVNDG